MEEEIYKVKQEIEEQFEKRGISFFRADNTDTIPIPPTAGKILMKFKKDKNDVYPVLLPIHVTERMQVEYIAKIADIVDDVCAKYNKE